MRPFLARASCGFLQRSLFHTLPYSSLSFTRTAKPVLPMASSSSFSAFSSSSSSSSRGLQYNSKLLFTPGPLGVSATTKQAMLYDLGSRDPQFMNVVKEIRSEVLRFGGLSADSWASIPLQGSGTFGVEAAVQTTVPRNGSILILINGAYGRRICDMAKLAGIDYVSHEFAENEVADVAIVKTLLQKNPGITNVIVVHCETSSGVLNPIEEIGQCVKAFSPSIAYMVDSMSAYGGIVCDFDRACVDVLVTSANKCLEGVPGFTWVLMKKDLLAKCGGNSRSLSLDVYAQYEGLEGNGQFRFTPPTHAILSFRRALYELEEEGGVEGRAARYAGNARIIWEEFEKLGFQTLLPRPISSHIITTYRFPSHPNFSFEKLYSGLSVKGCNIYPGKVTNTPCFRIGHIGHLYAKDMHQLVSATKEVLSDMCIPVPVPPPI